MSASNDTRPVAVKKEVAQRWMVWPAIDGQKSQNSGQAVKNIEEEGGACSSSCSTDNYIVPEVITIEGELRILYWIPCMYLIISSVCCRERFASSFRTTTVLGANLPAPSFLLSELKLWQQFWMQKAQHEIPSNISDTLISTDENAFRNIHVLLIVGSTLPFLAVKLKGHFLAYGALKLTYAGL